MRETLAAHGRRRDVGAGGGWSLGILVAIAISTSLASLVSAAQPGAFVTRPSAHATGTTATPALEENAQALDPGAPPKTTIQLAPFLTFGGRVKVDYGLERDFDLNNKMPDDLSILAPELSLAFSFDPNKNTQAFVNVDLSKKIALEEEGKKKKRPIHLELSQAFISFKEAISGLSIQIGRQRFRDDRKWLLDDALDAVRAFYQLSHFSLELSASRKGVADIDLLNQETNERINNYLLYGGYALNPKTKMAAYTLVRRDRSPDRKSPIFLGLHSSGEVVNDLEYWFELAHVGGTDGARRIRGIGLDLGSAYQFNLPRKPSIALGYAFGTGDANPNDQVDRRFRQTGLQDNSDKFHGVTSFKYYGELFDPELSNLRIFTGGIGIRPTRRSSVDLVYHHYLQDKASNKLRDSKIDAKPTGLSTKLGGEIDFIAGYREIRNIDTKLVLGYFIPGPAFPVEATSSFFANFEIRFNF